MQLHGRVAAVCIAGALLGCPAVASAGDLAGPQNVLATPWTWTGFYVGANVGYMAGSSSNGAAGGGQIGANWQTGMVVLGAEADLQGSSTNVKSNANNAAIGLAVQETASFNYFGTVRARAGVAWDRWLVYATGGFAYSSIDHQGVGVAGTTGTYLATNTPAGWTAGGGFEYALYDHLTVRLEYLYLRFNGYTNIYTTLTPPVIATYGKFSEDVIRAGVNYKF